MDISVKLKNDLSWKETKGVLIRALVFEDLQGKLLIELSSRHFESDKYTTFPSISYREPFLIDVSQKYTYASFKKPWPF